jgi:hypothetical protein
MLLNQCPLNLINVHCRFVSEQFFNELQVFIVQVKWPSPRKIGAGIAHNSLSPFVQASPAVKQVLADLSSQGTIDFGQILSVQSRSDRRELALRQILSENYGLIEDKITAQSASK